MWHPDGAAYVPRVHFYDGKTKQMLNITCQDCQAPEPYFYGNLNDVLPPPLCRNDMIILLLSAFLEVLLLASMRASF